MFLVLDTEFGTVGLGILGFRWGILRWVTTEGRN